LDLAAGKQGLHLIYGPNEAGKSSALRALSQLLYGIEERTADNFLHAYTSLRLGTTIRHSDGSELEFIRRKARINSLRGPDDADVLAANALERFLGGVDADRFRTLFGIDHDELVSGGQAIVTGGGRVGEAIFEASMGIVGLRGVRDQLQAECDDLFKPGGKKQRINETIQAYHTAQATIKKAQLSADEWAKHDRALRSAQEGREHLEQQWQQKSREHGRLSRIRNALAAIAYRKELLAELEAYRDAIRLPDDFRDKLRDLLASHAVADGQARQAGDTLEQLDTKIQQLVVPHELLHQGQKIEDLHRKLGEFEKGMEDRPRLVVQKKYLEHDAREILKSLGQSDDFAKVEGLCLRADEPVWIQNLGNQHQGLLADCRNARQKVRDLNGRIEKAQQDLASLKELVDPADLRRQIRQAQLQGALDQQLAGAEESLALAEAQATVEIARLPDWKGTLEALEVLPMPPPETIDRFETHLSEAKTHIGQLDDRIAEQKTTNSQKQAEIRQLELQQEVPSEGDLERARRERDAGWQLVREAWLNGDVHEQTVAEFVGRHPPAQILAEAYERSVADSDQLADRLRREADRVARKGELVSQVEQSSEQIRTLATQRHDQTVAFAELRKQWADLLNPLGLPPLLPKEMRAWSRQQLDLVRQARGIREQRERVRGLRARREDLRGRLGTCLSTLGEPAANQTETLPILMERAQAVVERHENVNSQRGQLQKLIRDREQELGIADAGLQQAEQQLAQWQLHWAKATARLGLPKDALPPAANAFLAAITELFQKLHEISGFESRIDGIDRDGETFSANVRALACQVGPDLESASPDQVARGLNARLASARKAQTERQALEEQRTDEQKKLRKANESLAASKQDLDSMCHEARCSTYDELRQAAERSARRKDLEKDVQQREEQILTHSAGATVEELIAQAEELDSDELGPNIQKLEEEIASLREQIRGVDTTIGSEQAELARMDGNSTAAEAAELAENLLAQLHTDVQEYAALRLAGVVLQKGIERFREKNQGSILKRASRIFSGLTVGAFAGLRIDYDDQGEPILLGIRPDGRHIVGVEGMSDGSQDQLYLALRLAALEDWLERHESIPFVVDDILIRFDNARAMAALAALADLSRRTQVIFFTHHKHLVELAQRNLDPSVVFTHELPISRGRTPTATNGLG
jgi:uncharacterized protein YhaN